MITTAQSKSSQHAIITSFKVATFRLNQSRISMRRLFDRVKALEEDNGRLRNELQSATGTYVSLFPWAADHIPFYAWILLNVTSFSMTTNQARESAAASLATATAFGARSINCQALPR